MKTGRQHRTNLAAGLSLLGAMTVIAGCAPKSAPTADAGKPSPGAAAENPPTPVTTTAAAEQSVTQFVPVTGSVTALQTISLTPKVTANVISVAGREGDFVHAGQIVVQLDTTDLAAQLRQSEANLQDAQAKLAQSRSTYELQVKTSATTVQNAKAALVAAQAALVLVEKPQRNEEIRQSEIGVQQAQVNYDKAVFDRKRYEALVKEGAEPQSTLDQYALTEKVDLATLDNAKETLAISRTGGRDESIQNSKATVAQAQIALQQAKDNVQNNAIKLADIRSAEASVAQNEAMVAYQRQQLSYCTIKSPIDGIISSRAAEPGSLAGAAVYATSGSSNSSGAVLTIVALDNVYYQAQVPETAIGGMQIGKKVAVSVDAYPTHTFTGMITTVEPTASTTSRNFNVRISIPNSGRLLRPGMFAHGQVAVLSRRGVVVPKDALVADISGTGFAVFVVKNGTTVGSRSVKIGIQTSSTSEILSGVSPGDQVVTAGQDQLKDGAAVTVEGNRTAETPAVSPKNTAQL